MATYNGEHYINDQIKSILNQELVEVKMLISDDGSKDSTLKIIKDSYPEIVVTQNSPGTGSAASNFFKMVCDINFDDDFDYVSFSDQDDIWQPEKVNIAVQNLQEKCADLYASNLTIWNMSDDSYGTIFKSFPQKQYDYLFEGGSAGCTYVFTKAFALRLKDFINQLEYSNWEYFSHDWTVYFFARSRGFKVFIDSESYIKYRIHNSNVHGHLNSLSYNTIKEKISQVVNGYYQKQVSNFIKYLKPESKEYKIYKRFLGNYFERNFIIWKYNFNLMRDKKKFIIFALINLIKFK